MFSGTFSHVFSCSEIAMLSHVDRGAGGMLVGLAFDTRLHASSCLVGMVTVLVISAASLGGRHGSASQNE